MRRFLRPSFLFADISSLFDKRSLRHHREAKSYLQGYSHSPCRFCCFCGLGFAYFYVFFHKQDPDTVGWSLLEEARCRESMWGGPCTCTTLGLPARTILSSILPARLPASVFAIRYLWGTVRPAFHLLFVLSTIERDDIEIPCTKNLPTGLSAELSEITAD
ncbi:hypothetical protein BJ322DRAFT_346358 [Thelephora terrestris]|uniref:Uncharacterized protein n=1 Tax=Thelephora terrestris TaxID=56493 RepID=A0A9P6L2L6_9AGAM|nr:hypothetical protein BJ322DRAFT_346358 [Thelephora terrestris]